MQFLQISGPNIFRFAGLVKWAQLERGLTHPTFPTERCLQCDHASTKQPYGNMKAKRIMMPWLQSTPRPSWLADHDHDGWQNLRVEASSNTRNCGSRYAKLGPFDTYHIRKPAANEGRRQHTRGTPVWCQKTSGRSRKRLESRRTHYAEVDSAKNLCLQGGCAKCLNHEIACTVHERPNLQ